MKKRSGKGTAIFAALCLLAALLLRVVPGMAFSARLAACAAAGFALLSALSALKRRRWARLARRIVLLLIAAGLSFFAVMEGLVISGAHADPPQDVSCVIVLGAGVNGTEPSRILASRLRAALAFLEERPEIPVIVSGGQGEGEAVTEAACMARWLTEHGVAPERILEEDRSANTAENFRYSFRLMEEQGIDTAESFAVVTSNFHLFRARRLADAPQMCSVAATLPRGVYNAGLQLNYFVREAFALAKLLVFGGVEL